MASRDSQEQGRRGKVRSNWDGTGVVVVVEDGEGEEERNESCSLSPFLHLSPSLLLVSTHIDGHLVVAGGVHGQLGDGVGAQVEGWEERERERVRPNSIDWVSAPARSMQTALSRPSSLSTHSAPR